MTQIQEFKCLYLQYQSMVDFTPAQDIQRCSPCFQGQERRDCVLINMDCGTRAYTCARLLSLLRCAVPSGNQHDVAIVHLFKPSSWKPSTSIENSEILDEMNKPQLVLMKYLIRGAHMVPVFCTKEGRFILNDLVDGDIFLRAGN